MERTRSPKFSKPVFTCGEGLRFATPEVVARYRAGRLRCGVLADISCGIGGQAVCFAKECGSVYGIDIDGERLECARRNAGVYGVDNITFIEGDALSPQVVKQVADADVIFSDPARPAEENVRQTDSLRPGIPMVMEAYRDVTDSFAFEAPPQMPPERVDFECEREYLSVDGQLNRLTLYFGPLERCRRSAVVLKGDRHYRLESSTGVSVAAPVVIPEVGETRVYAFEPDPAVVKAGLLGELAGGLGSKVELVRIDARRSLLTSDVLLGSPFFKHRYRVLDRVPLDCGKVNRSLMGYGMGKAVIRFSVAPDMYWDVRNRIENGLEGEGVAHLFEIADQVYVCEKI